MNTKDCYVVICKSDNYSHIVNNIKELGVKVVTFTPNSDLPYPISTHTDIFCHFLANSRDVVVYHRCIDLKTSLETAGFNVITEDTPLGRRYPQDILLNSFFVKNVVFCNVKHTSSKVLSYYHNNSYTIADVPQGYANCSCLRIGDNAFVTTDPSIYKAAISHAIDCLLISPIGISLPPYEHGFIGGCGGLINKNTLLMTGSVDNLTDKKLFIDFARYHGVSILSAGDTLLDCGIVIYCGDLWN